MTRRDGGLNHVAQQLSF